MMTSARAILWPLFGVMLASGLQGCRGDEDAAPLPPAFTLPDSGQTTCYDASGLEMACTGTGQDGEYVINPMSFTDLGEGMIKDDVTGLVWQKCSVGQTNDVSCSGTALHPNWYEASGTPDGTLNPGGATDLCGSLTLGGNSDWRLPSRMELMSIVDFETFAPAIDATNFPNTPSFEYWSSSDVPNSPLYASGVSFLTGQVLYGEKSRAGYVRCVRGASAPAPSYTDNGDDTVTDDVTGLMWQRCTAGQDNDAVCSGTFVAATWQEALLYCRGLSLGNHPDWRLPNVKELMSLVYDGLLDPAIDDVVFRNTLSGQYWSSTSMSGLPSSAWYVSFWVGDSDYYPKSSPTLVRCVR